MNGYDEISRIATKKRSVIWLSGAAWKNSRNRYGCLVESVANKTWFDFKVGDINQIVIRWPVERYDIWKICIEISWQLTRNSDSPVWLCRYRMGSGCNKDATVDLDQYAGTAIFEVINVVICNCG